MWINTIALTFLFFLLTLGFGLFILALASVPLLRGTGLTRLQLIALGFTIGAGGTGVSLQLLSLISVNPAVNLGAITLISLSGFLLTEDLWRPRRQDSSEIMLFAAVSLPVALFTWWWTFGAFSDYPFGDIGADVHWLKTAQEYADTGILNPYASQSYFDLRTALAGALSKTLGLDLLKFNWAYRYFSIICFLIVFYAVSDSVFGDPYRKWFAFFFAAASNTSGLLTNGSLAVAGSFVFLSVLLRSSTARSVPASFSALTPPTAAALLGLLLVFSVNNNTITLIALIALLLLFGSMRRAQGFAKSVATSTFSAATWSIALVLAHRGSYLFVPIAVAGWILFVSVERIVLKAALPLIKALWALALLLPLVCASILLGILAARLGYLPAMSASRLFSLVTFLIFGTVIKNGDDLVLGVGPEVAAIEIGRAMGPLFSIAIGAMFVAWWATHRPERLKLSANARYQSDNISRLLWSWIMGCGLCVIVLSGFPFLYRAVFVISGLFTIATTELCCQLLVDPLPDARRQRYLAIILAVVFSAVLVAAVYSVDWSFTLPYRGYQTMLRSGEIAGVILALVFALFSFGSRPMQLFALAAVFSVSVAVDRSVVSTLFKVYSYLPRHQNERR